MKDKSHWQRNVKSYPPISGVIFMYVECAFHIGNAMQRDVKAYPIAPMSCMMILYVGCAFPIDNAI